MAIQYVGGQVASRGGSNSSSSITFALAGGLEGTPKIGDLVLITAVVGSAGRNPAQAITGYTALGQLNVTAATQDTSLNVSYKTLTTAETTFTLPATGNNSDAQAYAVQVFRGVDRDNPLDVASVTATGTGTSRANPAAITPTTAGAWVVVCSGGAATATSNFTYAALTNVLSASGSDNNDAVVGCGYTTWTSGALDPAASSTGSANSVDSWAAYTIALRPALSHAALTETFDSALGASWNAPVNTGANTSQTQAAGKWEQTISPTAAGQQATLRSATSYNLIESAAYVKLAQAWGSFPGAGGEIIFDLVVVDGTSLQFIINSAGNILFGYRIADAYTEVAALTYSATDHKWLKLSHTSTTISWSTAPDADASGTAPGAWTSRATLAQSTFTPGIGWLYFRLGTSSSADVGAVTAKWDGLNTTATASGTALTGQSTTLARGTLGVSTAVALTGQSATAAAGTLSPGAELAGYGLTVSPGTLTPGVSVDLPGYNTVLSAGVVSVQAIVQPLTGAAISSAAGAMVPGVDVALTGQGAALAKDTLTAVPVINLALSGQAVTGTLGALAPNVSAALTGQAATASRGTLTPTVAGNGASSLVEDFEDALDGGVWTQTADPNTANTITGGRLEQTMSVTSTTAQLVKVTSNNAYTLTGNTSYVRLSEATFGVAAAGAETGFVLTDGANNEVGAVVISDGTIAFRYQKATAQLVAGTGNNLVAGTGNNVNAAYGTTTLAAPSYVAATHAWLRLRESGGTVYWDTAPSTASNPPVSGDWVNRASAAQATLGFSLALNAKLYAYASQNVGAITVKWDGLNTAATVAGTTNVNLIGFDLLTARGTLAPVTAAALTGQAATASLGTLLPQNACALSGQSATAAVGTLAPALSIQLTGSVGAAARGTLSPALTLTMLGLAAAVGRGAPIPAGASAALSTLVETFTNTLDAAVWALSAGPTNTSNSVVGGKLEQTCSVTSTTPRLASCATVANYDLSESSVYIKLEQSFTTFPGAGGEISFTLDAGSSNLLQFVFTSSGTLDFGYKIAGVWTALASATYSATAHKWVRFRHTGGTVFWDTAPDADATGVTPGTWVNRASVAAATLGFTLTVHAQVYVSTDQNIGSVTARWDGLNTDANVPAYVSIVDYGAVGDGVTNNLTAINNAVTAAKAAGLEVLVPAGTFSFSGGVLRLRDARMRGLGVTSVLYASDYTNASVWLEGSAPGLSHVKLSGAAAPARQSSLASTKIAIMGGQNFAIDRVYIENSPAASIQTAADLTTGVSAAHGTITNCTIMNSLSSSVYITGGANDILIEHTYVENSGGDGVAVVSYTSDATRCSFITARQNQIKNNLFGRNMSVMGGSDVTYDNNFMDGNATLAGLYIAQEEDVSGPLDTKASLRVSCTNNTIQNCGSTTTGHAAAMIFSDGLEAQDAITLTRNDIIQSGGRDGMRYYGPQTNILLDRNRYTGTGSAYVGGTDPDVTIIPYDSGSIGYSGTVGPLPDDSAPLIGKSVTVSRGALTPTLAKALTGKQLTTGMGSLAPSVSGVTPVTVALLGKQLTTGRGTLTAIGTALFTFTETFDAAAIDSVRWNTFASTNNTVTQSGGKAQITLSNANAPFHTALMYSKAPYLNLTESYGFVKVDQALTTTGAAAGAETFFSFEDSTTGGNKIGFWIQSSGLMDMHARLGDVEIPATSGSIAYDANAHKWLRIKHSGATILWQAAPSTASNPPTEAQWVTLNSTAQSNLGFSITLLLVQLGAAQWGGAAGSLVTNVAQFDGLNTFAPTLVTKALIGNGMNTWVGPLTPGAARALTGQSVTVARDTLAPSQSAPVVQALTGRSMTLSGGTPTVLGASVGALVGRSVTTSGGTLTPVKTDAVLSVTLVGQTVTISGGALGAPIQWTLLDTGADDVWSQVDTAQAPGWAPPDTTSSPGWT